MRAKALVAGAVLAAFALGVVASRIGAPSPKRAVDRQPVSGEAPERPSGTAGEHQATEDGARAAAIAFAAASQDWLYLSDAQVDRSVRAVVATAAADSLSRETVTELRAARDALRQSPGRVWWLVRPLASRVERFEPASARVVVWTVTVLSASDVAMPQAEWMRVAIELVWEQGAWRVQSVVEVPGPTPTTGTKDRPWQPEPLDTALDGFQRVGSPPGR